MSFINLAQLIKDGLTRLLKKEPSNLKDVGYWWSFSEQDLPDPVPYANKDDLDDYQRYVVAQYLRKGKVLNETKGYSWCRLRNTNNCKIDDHDMGSSDLTDGVWRWPEGLHHYVTVHKVKLPEEFVKHALFATD